MKTALKAQIARDFGTPCMVVDLDRVDANITRIQALHDPKGLANRPHIKTHKSPVLAQAQLDAGARGITCQKLGEAEVMADAGIDDILIATNLISAARTGRLAALQRRLPLKVAADNPVTLAAYAEAAKAAERPLDVMIECDTGLKRAGVETPEDALALAAAIKDNPWLSFEGLMYYPPTNGWPETQAFHNTMVAGLASLGLSPQIVSTGGSPNLLHMGELEGATEHRAGTCIFNDRMMIAAQVATLEDCALEVYATVVSRGGPARGILDSGSKTLTNDTGGLEGYGLILEHPEAKIEKFAEEHGFLDLSACAIKPEVGEIVRVVPNHVCVAVNMVDRLVTVRGDKVVGTLDVAARGMLV